MKAQMTVEFLLITALLLSYITSVLFLFSSTKRSLEGAVDRKLMDMVERWIEFVSSKPHGTLIRLELKPFPGRYLHIICGDETLLMTPSTSRTLETESTCSEIVVDEETTITIESFGRGVRLEIV